ncbi:MAG TPA: hypothetical protein VGC38_04260 [Pseudolabrys sp.]
MTFAHRILQALRNPDTSQPFARLVPFSWSGELLTALGGMLISFLIAGFWYPYWRIADMDFWIVYNAFLLNVPLPQEYFDHPGYLSILLLSYWLRALHGLGIVHVVSLNALPPANDALGFAHAWTVATQAGRVLSLLFAMGFVLAFSYLLRALVRDWRIAAVGGFLLAFSGGMAMQMRIMRTELLAAGFFMSALLLLCIVATYGQRWWRPAVIGLASLLITLAFMNKIQIIFLICALPVVALPFGVAPQPGFWDAPRRAWPALAVSAAVALIAAYLAKDIVLAGLSNGGMVPALVVSAPVYWTVIALWLGLGMAAYAVIWRVEAMETLTAMFAVIAGCMIGLLALYARYQPGDVLIVFHPFEQMLQFAQGGDSRLAGGSIAQHLAMLSQWAGGVIMRRSFILESSPRPTIFLEWFVIAATVIAIRRRKWRLVLQVAALMLTDWGIDTLGMARGLKQEYFILTDPLAIIAAALLIAKLTDLQRNRLTYPLGVALVAAHILVSQAEPVKHIFKTDGNDVLCGLYHNAQKVERLPVCK